MIVDGKDRPPGALGAGLYRAQSQTRHGWSGDWHLGPRVKSRGPSDCFAREQDLVTTQGAHSPPRRPAP